MTRAIEASNGLGTPPPTHRWMDAVLMLFVSLVQGVRITLQMIFNRTRRDWQTTNAREDLPQAKSGTHLQERTHTHGVILGLVPRVFVGLARGRAGDRLETYNGNSRYKAENDPCEVAPSRSALPRADHPALILSVSKDAADTAESIVPTHA